MKAVSAKHSNYRDKSAKAGQYYYYEVVAVTAKKQVSLPSRTVKIDLPSTDGIEKGR